MRLNPKSCMVEALDVKFILFTNKNWEGKQIKWELLHHLLQPAWLFLPEMSSEIPQNLAQCSFLRDQVKLNGLFEHVSLHNTSKTDFKGTILGFLIGFMICVYPVFFYDI